MTDCNISEPEFREDCSNWQVCFDGLRARNRDPERDADPDREDDPAVAEWKAVCGECEDTSCIANRKGLLAREEASFVRHLDNRNENEFRRSQDMKDAWKIV